MTGHDGATLYVLVDALGWEILRDRPFLDDVLTERFRLETILGYSSGAIPTLLTGRPPAAHGRWNLFYRSPETSPFKWTRPLAPLPRMVRENRVVRRAVRELSQRLSGYEGYFAIYNLPIDRIRYYDICERTDLYQPGGLSPARSIFDELRDGGVSYESYNYHTHTDAEILDLMPGRLQSSECRVFFLYLSLFDHFLHFNVSKTALVTEQLRWYEERLRAVVEAARRRWGSVHLHVFSDHGMTPIQQTRDVIREIEALGLRMPQHYLPVYDSTMARFWTYSAEARRRIEECLGGLPYGRLVPEAERVDLGISFPDGRYGDVLFVMEPGVLICPSDMGRIRFDGMHGFHPRVDPHAHAVYLSTERPAEPPQHITDVLPLLLRDAGLTPARPAMAALA